MATKDEILAIVKQCNSELYADLKKDIKNSSDELSSRIDSISTRFHKEIDSIKTNVVSLQHSVAAQDDLIARSTVKNQVVIRNIPILINENVRNLFNMICNVIGFDQSQFNIPNVYRVIRKNELSAPNSRPQRSTRSNKGENTISLQNTTIPPPIIIVNFVASWEKISFMRLYFKHANLDIKEIGYKTNGRIYISDNLTGNNYAIFRKAKELQKSGDVFAVKTVDGQIYVVRSPSDIPELIRSIADIS